MERKLRNEDVWRQCDFERPPSRRTLDRFITDFTLVAADVFIKLVHELAEEVPLGKLFRIDGTDTPVDQRDEDAQWNDDHSEDDFYYGYGCGVVIAAHIIPVAATLGATYSGSREKAHGFSPVSYPQVWDRKRGDLTMNIPLSKGSLGEDACNGTGVGQQVGSSLTGIPVQSVGTRGGSAPRPSKTPPGKVLSYG